MFLQIYPHGRSSTSLYIFLYRRFLSEIDAMHITKKKNSFCLYDNNLVINLMIEFLKFKEVHCINRVSPSLPMDPQLV